MLSRLGANAIQALTHLFNGCLEKDSWVWRAAKIIFPRKEGKTSYASASAYRPVWITSFIEGTKANNGTISQKPKSSQSLGQKPKRNKNTIRYLTRLVNQIKDEKKSKRKTVCFFIDFEKIYDSVWKRGLAVKLWRKGVTGKFMNLLDGFKIIRYIQLRVNGMKCSNQNCGEFGLPQGSVISPSLVKFFLHDFEEKF